MTSTIGHLLPTFKDNIRAYDGANFPSTPTPSRRPAVVADGLAIGALARGRAPGPPRRIASLMGIAPNAASELICRAREGLRAAYRDAHGTQKQDPGDAV